MRDDYSKKYFIDELPVLHTEAVQCGQVASSSNSIFSLAPVPGTCAASLTEHLVDHFITGSSKFGVGQSDFVPLFHIPFNFIIIVHRKKKHERARCLEQVLHLSDWNIILGKDDSVTYHPGGWNFHMCQEHRPVLALIHIFHPIGLHVLSFGTKLYTPEIEIPCSPRIIIEHGDPCLRRVFQRIADDTFQIVDRSDWKHLDRQFPTRCPLTILSCII